MNLISKFKKVSALSAVAVSALLLGGGLTVNATDPSYESILSSHKVEFTNYTSECHCALEQTKLLDLEPVVFFAPKTKERGTELCISIPQTKGASSIEVPKNITLLGQLISIDTSDFKSGSSRVRILAYVPIKRSRLSNNSVYVYIPQVVGSWRKPTVILVPESIDLVGAPVSIRTKWNFNNQNGTSNIGLAVCPQNKASLLSSTTGVGRFTSGSSTVRISVLDKNFQESDSCSQPFSIIPSLNAIDSSADKHTSLTQKLAEHSIRAVSGLRRSELPVGATPLSAKSKAALEKKCSEVGKESYITPKKNKLNLSESVSKSNGVQKTTLQKSPSPATALHREAKKLEKMSENISAISLSSQSEIETTDDEYNSIMDLNEDIPELAPSKKSDENKK